MNKSKAIIFFAASLLFIACGGGNQEKAATDKPLDQAEQSQVANNSDNEVLSAKTNIIIQVDGESYSIDMINQEDSYLKFYSADSDMNHDADFEIVSGKKEERLTVIIDGLDGKGKDNISGNTRFGETASLATFKKGELSISFTEGELNVEEVSRASGMVKLKANGLCTLKKGNSFADMKVDVPAQLEVNATIKDVKTLTYKKQ